MTAATNGELKAKAEQKAAKYLADLVGILRERGAKVEGWSDHWDTKGKPDETKGIGTVNGVRVRLRFEPEVGGYVFSRIHTGIVRLTWDSRPRTNRPEGKSGFDLHAIADRIFAHIAMEEADDKDRRKRQERHDALEATVRRIKAAVPGIRVQEDYSTGHIVLAESLTEQEAVAVAKALKAIRSASA